MSNTTSWLTRIAYCLVIMGAILPFGRGGWIGLVTGGSPFMAIPLITPLVFLVAGLYRIVVVVRARSTLDAPRATGFVAFMRMAGVLLLYAGAVFTVLGWLARPMMGLLLHSRTESGAEFVIVGAYIALLSAVGTIGLLLFELSRLRSFERWASGEV